MCPLAGGLTCMGPPVREEDEGDLREGGGLQLNPLILQGSLRQLKPHPWRSHLLVTGTDHQLQSSALSCLL